MVQSLGISIGNLNSYVAAGQGGGIEILLNEYSNRSTPSMVAFTDRSRSIGVDASSNFFMNVKNTIYDLMVLLGKPFKDLSLEDKGRPKYMFKLEEAGDGQTLVVVRHLGEERKFTITQVLAMLFTKLRNVAYGATDCVISCPQFFNEDQKNALVQAALIAGLNPLQIIPDMSAVVLNYAYYRTTRQDKQKFIAFIDFGQSNLQSVVAWLTPREDSVIILAAESESLGGQDFDKLLADYFVKEHNLNLTPKSYLKLVSSCEKLKKQLSANANEIPIHVESLISEDQDFTSRVDRATFESISSDLLRRVEACLKKTLENAQANFMLIMTAKAQAAQEKQNSTPEKAKESVEEKIEEKAEGGDEEMPEEPVERVEKVEKVENADGAGTKAKVADKPKVAEKPKVVEESDEPPKGVEVIEMVGGSTRIPAIKQLVQNVFNLTPSTTLNTDEAVARGCALHCASLHPGMKVKREVKILGSELFFKPSSVSCDKESRRIELELVTSDVKYQSTTEARNTLEEYIYAERSKLQEGDQFLNGLNETLDWLMSEEGEEASREEYINKMAELKKASEQRLLENNKNSTENNNKQ